MTTPAEVAGDPSAAPRRVPDFFVVGHAKCGTTALYEMLRLHPQIFMPAVKEPQYFARNHDVVGAAGVGKRFDQTGRRGESLEQYLSLFSDARPDQVVGEGSTFYLWSRVAPARIAEAQPRAQIVAILREPAEFLRSLHLQMLQNHAESEKDLGRALALEETRRAGREIPRNCFWPEALMYSERVRYVEQLRRYEAALGREQMLVLIYDDFKRDNAATVRRVLRFLGVDEHEPIGAVEANPSVSVRSVKLAALVRDVRAGSGPRARAARAAIRGLTTPALRRAVVYPLRRRLVYGAPAAPDEQLMAELRSRFAGEVEDLGEYLDRDLAGLWGYDSVK